jgi:diguanylate cyclase (GGDEF)-like protein/PAS domain S-box-containing protein
VSSNPTIRVAEAARETGLKPTTASTNDTSERQDRRVVENERMSLQTLIDWIPDNLWVKDTESRFIVANKATATQIGRERPEDLIGRTDFEFHAPELAQQFFSIEQQIIQSGRPSVDMEESVFDAFGAKRWISTTKAPLRDHRNVVFGLVGISRDITRRKQADVLRDGQARILEMIAMSAPLADVLDHLVRLVESQLPGTFGSVLLLDKDARRLQRVAAPSLAQAYTRAVDGIHIGPNAGLSRAPANRPEDVTVEDIMRDPLWGRHRELAVAHGYRSFSPTPILSHQDEVIGVFASYSTSASEQTAAEKHLIDAATRIAGIAIERKQAEDRIRFMTNHDPLTGLTNRALLKDRLSQAILYAERYDRWATVVFVDLDNFKLVNDSLGHNVGDELLQVVASRMISWGRSTDTAARLGGDKFAILLSDQPKTANIISATVQKIRARIAEPVCIDGHDLLVTGGFGIATYPDDGADADTLLANAEAAMYRAKESGSNSFQFYTPDLNTKAHERLLLQEELRIATTRGEFVLLYQPQVDLRTGRIFAVEALIRWRHPTLGVIAPIKFIPLAEETGLIVSIGDWVLREASLQNKAWQDAGLPHVNICVNVSARQFKDKSLVSRVVAALRESGLDPKYLELELTESSIMQDVQRAVATMKELQSLGVQLSIDDFGTGYSSLSALRTFPVIRLKIDKSFINELSTSQSDRAVASAMIALGQKLNLRVIAEGVETDDQVSFLRENNCDEMQGYHFSKPVQASEVEELLKRPAQELATMERQ